MNLLWLYSAVNHKHFEDLKIKVLTYYIMKSAPWRGAAVHGVGTKLSGQHLHPNVARHHTGTLWKAIIEKMCLSDMKLMLPPPPASRIAVRQSASAGSINCDSGGPCTVELLQGCK